MVATRPHRYQAIDALRGLAMVWMTAFHFCFDLNHFGYLQANFYDDPFWTLQRSAIVTLFLICAGLGQATAHVQQLTWAHFFRRWIRIAGCALLVSVASWFMFGPSFIYFGILHGLALMVLLARLTAGRSAAVCALMGVAVWALYLALPTLHQAWPTLDFLNQRAWNWLGLISRKPVTEDYAPLVPWMGTVWIALAAGLWWLRRGQACPACIGDPAMRPLAVLGRWSLPYYMVHQPLMIGALLLVRSLHWA